MDILGPLAVSTTEVKNFCSTIPQLIKRAGKK